MNTGWPRRPLVEIPSKPQAQEVIDQLLRTAGIDAARDQFVDLARVCRAGHIEADIRPFAGRLPGTAESSHRRKEAVLLATRRGFKILVNADFLGVQDTRGLHRAPRTTMNRYRFRVGHELGHTLFYDRDSQPPARVRPAGVEEEAFCDWFAGALMIPESVLARTAATPEAVVEVAERCATSLRVSAHRFAEREDVSAIVALGFRSNPATNADPAWRVEWSEGAFVPRFARLQSSIAEEAARVGSATGTEVLRRLGRLPRDAPARVSATRLDRYVLVVVYAGPSADCDVEPPSRPAVQMALFDR